MSCASFRDKNEYQQCANYKKKLFILIGWKATTSHTNYHNTRLLDSKFKWLWNRQEKFWLTWLSHSSSFHQLSSPLIMDLRSTLLLRSSGSFLNSGHFLTVISFGVGSARHSSRCSSNYVILPVQDVQVLQKGLGFAPSPLEPHLIFHCWLSLSY